MTDSDPLEQNRLGISVAGSAEGKGRRGRELLEPRRSQAATGTGDLDEAAPDASRQVSATVSLPHESAPAARLRLRARAYESTTWSPHLREADWHPPPGGLPILTTPPNNDLSLNPSRNLALTARSSD